MIIFVLNLLLSHRSDNLAVMAAIQPALGHMIHMDDVWVAPLIQYLYVLWRKYPLMINESLSLVSSLVAGMLVSIEFAGTRSMPPRIFWLGFIGGT